MNIEKLLEKIAERIQDAPQLENSTEVQSAHVDPINVETAELLNSGELEKDLINKPPLRGQLVEKVASVLRDQLQIMTIRNGKREVITMDLPGAEYDGEDL
jgi:hypothetical protein